MMLDYESLQIYLRSLKKDNDPLLEKIRAKAMEEGVPIIRDEMADFMAFLMKLLKPNKVLEVGAAVGYSALVMKKNLPDSTHITTMELDEGRIAQARLNFEEAKADNITLLEGDATPILQSLESEDYDFIFMDAAKGQYIVWLPEIMRILKKGGVLVTDNVLFDGDVLRSRYGVVRRDRTIHERLREYLYTLKNTEGLTTTIVNIGDGAALTIKD